MSSRALESISGALFFDLVRDIGFEISVMDTEI